MISLLRPTARILKYIFRKSKLDLKSPLLCALCKRTAGKKRILQWLTQNYQEKNISYYLNIINVQEVKKFK